MKKNKNWITFAERDKDNHPNDGQVEGHLKFESDHTGIGLVQVMPLKYDSIEVIRHRLVQSVRGRASARTTAATVRIVIAIVYYRRPNVVSVHSEWLRPPVPVLFRYERVPAKTLIIKNLLLSRSCDAWKEAKIDTPPEVNEHPGDADYTVNTDDGLGHEQRDTHALEQGRYLPHVHDPRRKPLTEAYLEGKYRYAY